jgi:hypothetical protein
MRRVRPSSFVPRLLSVCFAGLCMAGTGFAAGEDSHFGRTPDGSGVDYHLRAVPRRHVLDRLFADQDIKLEWRNRAVGDEPISGSFGGAPSSVARQLLARTSFVLVYDRVGGKITRVIVVGRAGAQPSPALAALEAAMQPTGKSDKVVKAGLPGTSAVRAGDPPVAPDIAIRADPAASGALAGHTGAAPSAPHVQTGSEPAQLLTVVPSAIAAPQAAPASTAATSTLVVPLPTNAAPSITPIADAVASVSLPGPTVAARK